MNQIIIPISLTADFISNSLNTFILILQGLYFFQFFLKFKSTTIALAVTGEQLLDESKISSGIVRVLDSLSSNLPNGFLLKKSATILS